MEYGYIEKDWGISFPKSYLWCQANNFQNDNCSMFLSIADIPLKRFNFKGFICDFFLDDKEYRFATYNNSKIKEYKLTEDTVTVSIKKRNYSLNITCSKADGCSLSSPVKGNMAGNIVETLNSTMNVALKKGSNMLYSGTSPNTGLEIVQ